MRTIRRLRAPLVALCLLTAAATGVTGIGPLTTRAATPAAALSVTPSTVNRGGLVTVSGAGFAARETVLIFFNAAPKTVTSAAADANGLIPATGVTVPYTLGPGPHRLTALGSTSKRSAHATVAVQALTPTIGLATPMVKPGATETVTGTGFGARERVTLALNGAALVTRPDVVTTAEGAFTTAFIVPSRLLDGPNTIGAVGNRSRVAAVTTLTGTLPIASHFYFAGALNTAAEHSYIDLLNPHAQPATVRLTFYFANGQTAARTVDVAPTRERTFSVSALQGPSGTFGLYVEANRAVSAQVTITRDGKDGDGLLGNTGLGTRWYLAEGYTGLTFHESVSILNPDPATPARVQLRLLPLGGGPGKTVPVTVAPHANTVTDINSLLPGQSVSIVADSNLPVVVERTLTFGPEGYGLTTRSGTNTPATSWIFAEGTTVNRFQTFLTVLNPNAAPAHITASFFGSTGGSLGSRTIVVAASSRANLKENDFLNASGIASVVTSDLPVVVERPEYFGSPNDAHIAGSDVFGENGAGVRWSFPGGNTEGNSEFLLLYNPSQATVPVDATFYGSNGARVTKRVFVPPTVRYTLNVNTLIPGFAPIHGAVLTSTTGQGFVAEQTVFAPDHSTLRSTQGLAQ